MSNDYNVKVKLLADAGQFRQGMAIANRELALTSKNFSSFGDKASEQSSKLQTMLSKSEQVGKGMLVAGGAIAAGLGFVIKSFADYSAALSEFKAATGETDAVVDKVGKTAQIAGQKFGFTAVEALQGATALSKAGVSAADVLGGALSGALTLAATDTISVADAAETASIAMTQFKLSGKDVPHIADLLAAGAGKAVGSVSDLSLGLRQGGLVAAQFGLSIEDTIGTLSAFAKQGLIGSDAGTSLKTMLLALANPSKEAADRMEELGLHAYDAAGQFVGITGLADQLKEKLGGLSQAQRDQTLALIFGNDAVRSANALYKLGAEGLQEVIDQTNDAGYAQKIASQRLNNLAGDWGKLTASIQNGFINAGTGANDVLRGMTQAVTGLIQWVSSMPTPVLTAGLGIAALTAIIALGGGTALIAVPKYIAFREAVASLGPIGTRITGVLGTLAKAAGGLVAIGVGVAILQALGDAAKSNLPKVETFVNSLKQLSAGDLSKKLFPSGNDDNYYANMAESLGLASANAARFGEVLDSLQDRQNSLDKGWSADTIGNIFGIGTQKNIENVRTLSSALAQLGREGDMSGLRTGFETLRKEMNASDEDLSRFIQLSPELKTALTDIASSAGLADDPVTLLKIATGQLLSQTAGAPGNTAPFDKAMGLMSDSAKDAAKQLSTLLDLLFETGIKTRTLQESEDALAASTDDFTDGIKSQVEQLEAKYEVEGRTKEQVHALAQAEWDHSNKLDKNTEAGRQNREGLRKIADAGAEYVKNLITQGKSNAQVQGAMDETYKRLITAEGQLGITGKAADSLARQILGIPPGVNIKTWMSDQAKRAAGELATAVNALDGRVVNIYTVEHIQQVRDSGNAGLANSMTTANQYAQGNAYRKAGGGAIYGRGPKGIDSEWVLAAPGEHVWTAQEVDAMGGQAAMYALRAAVREYGAGALQYAQPAMPVWGVASSGTTQNIDAGLHIGTVVAADPQEAVRVFRTSQHDANAMAGLTSNPF